MYRWWRLCLLAAVSCVACGGRPVLHPDEPLDNDPLTAVEQFEQRLSILGDESSFRVRFNPPACPCTPFELGIGDEWIPVQVDWDTEPDGAAPKELIELGREAVSRFDYPQFWLIGRITKRAYICGASSMCARLVVYAWSKNPPEPTPAPPE